MNAENALRLLFEYFDKEATEGILLAYVAGLSDLSCEQIVHAVEQSIKTLDSMPKVATLRRLAGLGSPSSRAIEAWGDVLKALPLGSWRSVCFDDRIINAVIRNMGGWPSFVSKFRDEATENWARLNFIKCYESFASHGVNGEAMKPLAGEATGYPLNGRIVEPPIHRVSCNPVRLAISRDLQMNALESRSSRTVSTLAVIKTA
jgi:hypothetical protein